MGFLMRRPMPSDRGKSLLFITRPSAGPFGSGGGGTAIFAVDKLEVSKDYVLAKSPQGDYMFSKDMPYLLIPRSMARPVSTTDMAKSQLSEQKEWEAVMNADVKDEGAAVTLTEDGRTQHRATGYL